LVPHIAEDERLHAYLGAVGYVPALMFVLTQGLALAAIYRQQQISARQAGGLFLGLGLAVFSLGLAFGFILYQTDDVQHAREILAVPVALAGLPLLLGGTIAAAKLHAPTTSET